MFSKTSKFYLFIVKIFVSKIFVHSVNTELSNNDASVVAYCWDDGDEEL